MGVSFASCTLFVSSFFLSVSLVTLKVLGVEIPALTAIIIIITNIDIYRLLILCCVFEHFISMTSTRTQPFEVGTTFTSFYRSKIEAQ